MKEKRDFSDVQGWRRWAGFFLLNFATPVAFFIMFQKEGAKPAIALALGVTLVQILVHLVYRIRFSPFFMVATAFTIVFGTTDLVIDRPRFYRLAPAAQNFVIATGFLAAVLGRVPVVEWFAHALPAVVRPDTESREGRDYLRRLSWIWVGYLYGKSVLFFWLALVVDLGTLILLRAIIGGVTLWGLILGEIYYRKKVRPRRGCKSK